MQLENNLKRSKKAVKRAFYKSKATKFKKLISVMLLFGIVASVLYFVRYSYQEYAVSRAHVILNYPEIAESKYPDGSRFTYYDLVCDENLEEAIRIMQDNGKYKYFTVDDLRDNFYIYSYLDGSAGASVSSARSDGNDFSYVANEYKITFVQPHEYKNPNFFKKLFGKDYSGEFLRVLVNVNKARISEDLGGINGFKVLAEPVGAEKYDYIEEINVYRTKINNVLSYLKQIEKKKPGFVSEKHGLSLNDLREKYKFLISNNLDGINDFVASSGISKDISQASNKINVNIENNNVKYYKAYSKVSINNFAMQNYDQTFTENLINVIQNDEYGLYQARPKTAFDTVSSQKHLSDENVSEYTSKINIFTKELGIFQNSVTTPGENMRLITKCDGLIADFEKTYVALNKIAGEVVEEYYNTINEDYVSVKISKKGIISKNLIVKMGIAFLLGTIIAFIIMVFVLSFEDRREINRRKELIKAIKARNEKEGA